MPPEEQQQDINMSEFVGKIRLKNLVELQSENHVDTADIPNTFKVDDTTPEKHKKARKARAATTTRKKTSDETKIAQVIVSSTTIKRTGKKEPLPGQMRIDSFFKSSSKSFKVEPLGISPAKQNPQRPQRKGRKRLFDEESSTTQATTDTTSTFSEIDQKKKPITKRSQPPRTAKTKCTASPSVIIDLCSDDESESERNKSCEIKSAKRGVLESRQQDDLPFVSIPNLNLSNEVGNEIEAASKENIPKGRKRKRCPPYKVVEDTTFAVDGFQFGDIPNATHYFLTHYHADHYVGLTRKFSHPLYMSPITASLVETFIPVDKQYVHEIDVDQSIVVNDIEVTAIDANHCPGAIMLLFKLSTGKCILHTGDFRASFEMESLPIFWNVDVDLVYLDTTYLSKNYDFCHQSDSIYNACSLVRQFHEKNASKRILHVCGSYLIGKEKVWMALAEEFELRVWTEPNRRKAINCLNWPELKERLCDDPYEANMHVISMGKISYPQLDQYFKQFESHFDMLLGIRPSGWEKNSKPSYGKRISVIGVEYSEHSSYRELERFVRFLKPKSVISTVPVQRDLCVTAIVPSNWYNYKGIAGMISTGYQPSITTFFETPQRQTRTLPVKKSSMIVSPVKNINITYPDDIQSCVSDIDDDPLVKNAKTQPEVDKFSPSKSPAQAVSRFTSDASDDLLSFR